LVSGRNL